MPNTNHNTINLKDDGAQSSPPPSASYRQPLSNIDRTKRRAEEIDRFYQAKRVAKPAPAAAPAPVPAEASEPTVASTVRADLQTIRRPEPQRFDYGLTVRIVISILALAGIVAIWFFVFRTPEPAAPAPATGAEAPWYVATLANGEKYYGQIDDEKADPLVIRNVYCDYDQAIGAAKDAGTAPAEGETSAPKLLKNCNTKNRTDGTLRIVRGREDIKLERLTGEDQYLKAILLYESK